MRRASLRVRITALATLVVALALAVAGVVLASALRASQLDALDAALTTRAGDIESLVEGDALPALDEVSDDPRMRSCLRFRS